MMNTQRGQQQHCSNDVIATFLDSIQCNDHEHVLGRNFSFIRWLNYTLLFVL